MHLGGSPVPGPLLDELESAYLERRPLIIEVDPDWHPGAGEVEECPVWSLGPGFTLPGQRLHQALRNALDARGDGAPSWVWAAAASRLGARPGGTADVVLADGTPALIDGGPLQHLAPAGGPAVIPALVVEHGALAPLGPNRTPAELASDQLRAVTHPGGSARIIAPAGSGKTRVLAERARLLRSGWGIPASALCLVAFNKRAAVQMGERTADLPGMQIRTLNSLGLAILGGSRQDGSSQGPETIDETTVRRLLQEVVSLPRRANADPAAAWIEALSAVRLGLRSPEEVEAAFQGDVDGLAEAFPRYRDLLAERAVVDFDEQIYRAIELLATDPQLRERAQLSCRVMLVDEFQDLTPAHLLLIRLLAGPAGSVFGVGDDDQTIYGYAGATPKWLVDFAQYFPGSGSHQLEVNYRCPPQVTRAASTLLTHNRVRIPKQIRSAGISPGPQEPADGLTVVRAPDPVGATVAAVRRHLNAGYHPTQVAVLTRVNSSLAPAQLSLQHEGVPVNRAVGTSFLQRTGVRAALGWLAAAIRPDGLRGADIGYTARRPPRALSPKVIEWMSEQRSVDGLRSLAARLGDRDAAKVDLYTDDLEHLADRALAGDTAAILSCLRDEIGLAAAMAALDSEHRRLDRSPQTDDIDALIALGALHPDPTGFAEWLYEGLSRPGDNDGVTLATIHAVKGREWDHVVVHDATSGLVPHRLAADLEEERRVFHVALTRCRLTGTVVAGSPASPFLDQMMKPAPPLPEGAEEPVPDPAFQVPARSASAGQSAAAFERLRDWRWEKAREQGRPAFTVFHDTTLQDIASSGARTLAELARIKGVGPVKLENFGDEILAVLDAGGGEAG